MDAIDDYLVTELKYCYTKIEQLERCMMDMIVRNERNLISLTGARERYANSEAENRGMLRYILWLEDNLRNDYNSSITRRELRHLYQTDMDGEENIEYLPSSDEEQ